MQCWVGLGLAPSEFWAVTPAELGACLRGADDRRHAQLRRDEGLVYVLAQLVGVALGNPKKFPKFDRVFPDPRAAAKSDEEVLAFFGQLARLTGGDDAPGQVQPPDEVT